MLFIDFLTLMLLNMAAGFVVLAAFLLMGLPSGDWKRWVASFAIVGLVAIVTGFHMTFAWPLPGSYSSAFGEMSVLLGAIYLGIALSLAMGWGLGPLVIYGIFAGLAAVLLGIRFVMIEPPMTAKPALSCVGFVLSGGGGILAVLAFCKPLSRFLRTAGAVALILAALIWAMTAYPAYWMHMKHFSDWKPSTFQVVQPLAQK